MKAENKVLRDEKKEFLKDIQNLKQKLAPAQNEEKQKGSAQSSPKSIAASSNLSYEKYQKSAQDLIKASKEENSSLVLGPMKALLLACREVTEECEKIEDDPNVSEDDKDSIFDIKTNLSKNLTSLMQSTKSHASSPSSDSEKQIEKELSKLSFCISDLFELIKIIESEPAQTFSTKRQTMKLEAITNNQEPLPPLELGELRVYLNEQIDSINQLVKDLSRSMTKQTTSASYITGIISDIAQCVDNIVYETQGTIDIDNNLSDAVLNDCDDVLALLSDIRNDILDMGDLDLEDRNVKQKLQDNGYEIQKVFYWFI